MVTEEKKVYPDIEWRLNYIVENGKEKMLLKLETYLRLKKKGLFGRYYLLRFKSESVCDNIRYVIEELNHFHAGIYKASKTAWVNEKIVLPGHWDVPKPMFELDPDQTPEEKRLRPEDL